MSVEQVAPYGLAAVAASAAAFLLKWRGAGYTELHQTCETLQKQITQLYEHTNHANQRADAADTRAAAAEIRAAAAEKRAVIAEEMRVAQAIEIAALREEVHTLRHSTATAATAAVGAA